MRFIILKIFYELCSPSMNLFFKWKLLFLNFDVLEEYVQMQLFILLILMRKWLVVLQIQFIMKVRTELQEIN
jgi:hypothetical protein